MIFHKKITNKRFAIIAYYTLDSIYREEVKRLISSLNTFNLDYYIEGIPLLGDWKTCTDYKATFILRAISYLKTPVIFIDADGEVIKYPELFECLNADVAAFINHINNLLSGTVYFANNNKVKKLIKYWIYLNSKNDILFEQKMLQRAIQRSSDIIFEKLPIGYCQIHNYKIQAEENKKYILHWQASRRTKKLYPAFSQNKVLKLVKEIEYQAQKYWNKE